MKIKLEITEDLNFFLEEIMQELNLKMDPTGKKIELIPQNGILRIENSKDCTKIYYQEKAHLFRALCLWLSRSEEAFEYEEFPQFEKIGPMLDLSRNAVLTVDSLKRFILLCSKMGLNSLMLYMEDTYEIPQYPYFGHYRGRYSQKELRELDRYANQLGIELIPAIQTLAHLTNPLKWDFAEGIRDTSDILLVGEEKTYQFIEAAVASISSCFKTKKVHIGMDEAHDLGRGIYLEKNGLEDRFTIMEKHLKAVVEICEKYQLKPMMWSDMFFRIGSKTGDYYDSEITFPETLAEMMPEVEMVYWDYYHHEEKEYERNITNHKLLGRPIIFAGGVWTWNGIAPNYGKTFATTRAGLAAAKRQNIKQIYATLWGDDGAETPVISSLLGLQQFSEEQFQVAPDLEFVKDRFSIFHQIDANDFLLLDKFDQTPGVSENNPYGSHSSKLALYQDLLFGLHEESLKNLHLKGHYQTLQAELENVRTTKDTKKMFDFYIQLASVLAYKVELNEKITGAYTQNNKVELEQLKNEIEQLLTELYKLRKLHRDVWFEWNKPFGYEIIDLRYGALANRIDTAQWRLTQYLQGSLDNLEELEAKRLPFRIESETVGCIGRNMFEEIYSPSKISGV